MSREIKKIDKSLKYADNPRQKIMLYLAQIIVASALLATVGGAAQPNILDGGRSRMAEHTTRAKPPKEYTCKNCQRVFLSKRGCATRTPQYCSRHCHSARQVSVETRMKQSLKKKGRTAWNKGLAMWSERPHPRGTLGMKFPERSGASSPFWKGGVSSENERARKSPEYKQWRRQVFERDNFTCQECGQRGGQLHADHIKPFAIYTALRYDVSNGRTLCVGCHLKTDTYGGKVLKLRGRNA